MKLNLIEKIIGSGFLTGYVRIGSGTVASLIALFIFLIPGFENPTLMMLIISICIVMGIKLGDKFETIYGKDPSEFTLDEFIGTWIAFLFLPKKIWFIIPTFLIWRLLDIIKPFPANRVERIKGGWGIILDDIISALYTFLIVQTTIHFFNRIFQ